VIPLTATTRVLCLALIAGILFLGLAPARFLDAISKSLAHVDRPPITDVEESAETTGPVLPPAGDSELSAR
jgi:hypothetical protein